MVDEVTKTPSTVEMQQKHWYQSWILWLCVFTAMSSIGDGLRELSDTGKLDVGHVFALVFSVAGAVMRARMADVFGPGERGKAS